MEGSVRADVRRGQLLSDVLLGSGDEEECVKKDPSKARQNSVP